MKFFPFTPPVASAQQAITGKEHRTTASGPVIRGESGAVEAAHKARSEKKNTNPAGRVPNPDPEGRYSL
jgi:hypothetical protein